jgi:hypothetical protein
MAEKSIRFGTPEVVSNYKNELSQKMQNSGNSIAQSYRRMFPNWDAMSEEQKQQALAVIDAQQNRAQMDIASIRAKAFRDELNKTR